MDALDLCCSTSETKTTPERKQLTLSLLDANMRFFIRDGGSEKFSQRIAGLMVFGPTVKITMRWLSISAKRSLYRRTTVERWYAYTTIVLL